MQTTSIKAYGTEAADADIKQLQIKRRLPLTNDVEIDIMYCGVCHSDLHFARNDGVSGGSRPRDRGKSYSGR